MKLSEWLRRSVKSIMVREVFTLNPNNTLADAASVFLREQISGAPVCDDNGECVGVLSVTDIAGAKDKAAKQQAEIADEFFAKSELVLPTNIYAQRLIEVRDKLIPAAAQPISNFMATNLVTVQESDTLETVVRDMVDDHLHRVIVCDDEGKLVGIITTIDVLASLLHVSEGLTETPMHTD